MGEFQVFILIGAGVFIGIILLATIVKLRQQKIASKWPQTSGQVVQSKIEAREKRNMDGSTTTGNYPLVVYEYEIDGKKYTCKKISVGEEAADFMLQETIAKYPVGITVPVYYNPGNPRQAVLERDLPTGFGKGLGCILLFFVIVAAFLILGEKGVEDWLTRVTPQFTNVKLAALVGAMGAFVAALAISMELQIRAANQWPTASGKIMSSGTQEYRDSGADHSRLKMYRSKVVYEYHVAGQKYTSDKITQGEKLGSSSQSLAGRTASKYKVGDSVQVYYNPKNPSEAILNRTPTSRLIVWLLAAGLLGLAFLIATGRVA
jgi:hypothetical protein